MPHFVLTLVIIFSSVAYVLVSLDWWGSSKEHKFRRLYSTGWWWAIGLSLLSCIFSCWLVLAYKKSKNPVEIGVEYHVIKTSTSDNGSRYQFITIAGEEKNITNMFGKYFDQDVLMVEVKSSQSVFLGVTFKHNGESTPEKSYHIVKKNSITDRTIKDVM